MIPDETRSASGQPLTAVELGAWRGLLRASVRLRRELGRRLEAAHGLTIADYDALVCLAAAPGGRIRMAALADTILQPRSSVTRIVDGLQHRGLVRRCPADGDGRGSDALLTSEGRAAFNAAQRDHHDNIRELFLRRLGDDQLAQLAGTWDALERDG